MTFSQNDEMSVDHSQLTRDSSSWDLLIKNVKPRHAGIYECQVTANHLIAHYVTLNVIGKSVTTPVVHLTLFLLFSYLKRVPFLAVSKILFHNEVGYLLYLNIYRTLCVLFISALSFFRLAIVWKLFSFGWFSFL